MCAPITKCHLLQLLGIPDWVGPGGPPVVGAVVVTVVVVLTEDIVVRDVVDVLEEGAGGFVVTGLSVGLFGSIQYR